MGLWVKKNGCIGITQFILFSDTKSLVKCRLDDLKGDHPEWYVIYRRKDGSGERAGERVLVFFKTVANNIHVKIQNNLLFLEPGKMLQRLHEGDGLSCGQNLRGETVQSENVFIFKSTGTKIGIHEPAGCFQRGFKRCLEMPNR